MKEYENILRTYAVKDVDFGDRYSQSIGFEMRRTPDDYYRAIETLRDAASDIDLPPRVGNALVEKIRSLEDHRSCIMGLKAISHYNTGDMITAKKLARDANMGLREGAFIYNGEDLRTVMDGILRNE
ncbi:MAG: hypothetical protein ACMXYL_00285 [Candidatus Woesearchaeota archaeon]